MADEAPDDVSRLLEFLHDHDVACPFCRYNLRGLTRPLCPECNHRLVLTVGVRDVRFGWFLATVTPGLFSGIAAVLLAIPILAVPLRGGSPAPAHIVGTDLFGWASGLAALVLILLRRRFLTMPASRQIIAAAAAWAVHLFAFAVLMWLLVG